MAVVEKPRFFPHIEGLRGLAALYVFLYHLTQVAVGTRSPFNSWAHWWLPLQYGHYAVAVFIVISGFVLGAPVARTGSFDARTFARKRFRRLYPAYITALILSLPTFYFYASVVLGKHPKVSHVALGLLAHAFLIHNLSRELITYINPPMWSIGLECQIYVVFALLLVPVWRRLGAFSQLGTALIVGLAPHYLLHGALDWTYPWFLALFAVGVCAASLVTNPIALPWSGLTIFAAIATATLLLLDRRHALNEHIPSLLILPDLAVGVSVALFIVESCTGSRTWMPTRFLSLWPIQTLGAFSYSLYLIHILFIETLAATLIKRGAPPIAWAIGCLVTIPIVLAAAYGFYLLVERPFLNPTFREALDKSTRPSANESLLRGAVESTT